MGRQICFFATQNDYFFLFDYIVESEWFFIDESGDTISLDRVKEMVQSHYDNQGFHLRFYITKNDFKIVRNIYNNDGEKIIRVNELYSDVIEIIICSSPSSNIRGLVKSPNQYEHGRFGYERQYYDQIGNIIIKRPDLDKMHQTLVRKVRKNGINSKKKFAYILPDAYRRYKEGTFIPCSGRNTIEFD